MEAPEWARGRTAREAEGQGGGGGVVAVEEGDGDIPGGREKTVTHALPPISVQKQPSAA
jgi:hypothetical protein